MIKLLLLMKKIAYLGTIKHQLFNKIKGSPVERKQEKWANEKAGFSI